MPSIENTQQVTSGTARISKTVVFYFNGSFVPPTNGAHVRAVSFLTYLASKFDNVVVYSFRTHPSRPWNDHAVRTFKRMFPTISLVLEESTLVTGSISRVKLFLLALWPTLGTLLIRTRIPYISPRLDEIRSDPRNQRCQYILNYADGVTKINGLSGASVMIDAHDVSSASRAKHLGRRATSLKSMLQLRGELAALDCADVVIAISSFEGAFFRMLLSRAKVLFVPQFPSAPAGPFESDPARYQFDFIFVGSENTFNIRGLLHFMTNESAWSKDRSLVVCGGVCKDSRVKQYAAANPNVRLLGFVGDLKPIYSSAKVAISPVDGTGLKIKVVEALAHGKPVLASAQSLDGLPAGWQDCVFRLGDPRGETLLDDASSLQAANAAARFYFHRIGTAGEIDALWAELDPAGAELGGQNWESLRKETMLA